MQALRDFATSLETASPEDRSVVAEVVTDDRLPNMGTPMRTSLERVHKAAGA